VSTSNDLESLRDFAGELKAAIPAAVLAMARRLPKHLAP
jgi:hypothetical protein